MKMEELGQNVGYLLYRTQAEWDADKERVRVIDGRDRMQLFVDGNFITTQYQTPASRSYDSKPGVSRFS